MVKYSASSEQDLIALTVKILWHYDDPLLAAHIHRNGLMRLTPADDDSALALRILDNSPEEARNKAMVMLFAIDKDQTIAYIKGTIEHLLEGTDTEDTDSVGGFSQREIDSLASFFGD